jgi:hypothetical protein
MRLPYWLCLPFLPLVGVVHRARKSLAAKEYARTPDLRRARAQAEKRPEPAPRLEIEVIEAGQEVVVSLRGEAGVAEAGVPEASLLRLVARTTAKRVSCNRQLCHSSSTGSCR